MRTILEALPGALFPDLQKETDDPGVESNLLDDDLVRPAAEDELPRHAQRGRKSPLARHLVHTVDPLDRNLPVTFDLRLSLEGARVTDVTIDAGFTHQALERRARGQRIGGAGEDLLEVFRLVSRIDPGIVAVCAVAVALERGAGIAPTPATTAERQIALDLATIAESARVLAQPSLGHDVRDARAAARAAAALLDGLCAGDVFCSPFRLRRAIAAEERAAILSRLTEVETPWRRVRPQQDFDHLQGVGTLNAATARSLGVQGPALRATGAVDDTPTIDLEAAPPTASIDCVGDTLARLCVRYDDGTEALRRLRDRLQKPVSHDDKGDAAAPAVKDGITTGLVRGPSGTTAVLLSIADGKVERLRVRPPDLALVAALPRALVDVPLEDLAAVIASFGIQVSAVDR